MKEQTRRPKSGTLPVRVLFLSTGNAARSPIAESILNWVSRGQAVAASAGVAPLSEINPMAREAVRKVVNARIVHERPQSVASFKDDTFEYVFTLSQEALEGCPCLPDLPVRVHWPLEDPAAIHGSRDQRQHAFNRVARELAKRLRTWWRCRDSPQSAEEPAPKRHRRPGKQARWRTRPGADAPILAVAYFGPMRSCINMCALFERSGFQVLCGDKYGRTPETLPIRPDAVIVRVDGNRHAGSVRPEFRAVQALRSALAEVPMLVVGDRSPSEDEKQILKNCSTSYIQRRPHRNGHVVKALEEMVSARAT
jgi:arsenate reductase (thioredoxin)